MHKICNIYLLEQQILSVLHVGMGWVFTMKWNEWNYFRWAYHEIENTYKLNTYSAAVGILSLA